MAGSTVRLLALVVAPCFFQSAALKPIEWQRRTTYQVLTDRFALPPGGRDTCNENPENCLWGSHCGGTWEGVLDKLDYIQGMGFDAIYISPIVKNIPCGYHGYWNGDLWTINPRFGGEEALQALMDECHRRDIAVLVDTVYNHMGPPYFLDPDPWLPTDFNWIVSQYYPFNKTEYFHQSYLEHCDAQNPLASQYQREKCWMGVDKGACSDLAHEHPFVADQLIQWTKHMVGKYQIDGIRADAVPYVNKSFWQRLKQEALADTYIVGEVVIASLLEDYSASYQYTSEPESLVMSQTCQFLDLDCNFALEASRAAILADHVSGDILDGLLSTLMKAWIRKAFQTRDGKTYEVTLDDWAGNYHYVFHIYKKLGNGAVFIDTHDDARWFHLSPDWRTYRCALSMVFFLPGFPIAYYGAEQGVVGPGGYGTNASREPLWHHSYDTDHSLYRFTAKLVKARKAAVASLPDGNLGDEPYFYVFPPTKSSMIAWWRGDALLVLSQMNSKIPCACIQASSPPGTCMYDALSDNQDNTKCVLQEGLLQVDADAIPHLFFRNGSCGKCARIQTRCSQTCSGAPATLADAVPSSSRIVAGLLLACVCMVWLGIHSELRSRRLKRGQQPLLAGGLH